MTLDLHSEPYRPEGNIDARASRRALSQSDRLDTWDLLLRETLQNSWDARRDRTGGGVHFRIDSFFPSTRQQQVLREEVFVSLPPRKALGEGGPLDDSYPVLVISDWGTRGLAGPTRADISLTGEVDFVDFVRNVGRAEQKALGGGTYGFGKGVLYESSICSTVIVFTRTTHAGRPVSRFMAIRLGSSYDMQGSRFTGRHWWGRADPLTGAEPVTGPEAERLAAGIGLNMIPADQTGTSFVIIGPIAKKEGETTEEVVQRLANAALYWAWPHMVDPCSIHFEFYSDGEPVAVPDPATHPSLRDYVAAYLRARDVQGGSIPDPGYQWQDDLVRSGQGGRTVLGALSVRRRLPGDEPPHPEDDVPDVRNHVALMRDPRFVVKYRDVPPDPTGRTVAGVFIADPEHNGQFAMAEPPAHDDWIAGNVPKEKYARNVVKQALNRLTEMLRPARPQAASVESATLSGSLVHLAGSLGSLLDGQPGGVDARTPTVADSPGVRQPSGIGQNGRSADDRPGGTDRPSRGRHTGGPEARVVERPTLRLLNGRPVVVFAVEVNNDGGGAIIVSAQPLVIVDGGTERSGEAPLGAPVPRLLGWSANLDDPPGPGAGRQALRVAEPGRRLVWAWATQPADTPVGLAIEHRAEFLP